jgi:hypothetical protein
MTKRSESYEVYCKWCRDHLRPEPTREWWEMAIHQPKTVSFEPDFDIDTERREGWTYQ